MLRLRLMLMLRLRLMLMLRLRGRIGRRACAVRMVGSARVMASAGLASPRGCKQCPYALLNPWPRRENGFVHLKLGGHLASIPWDTLLSALVGGGVDGPAFCVVYKTSDAVRHAVLVPCARRANIPSGKHL